MSWGKCHEWDHGSRTVSQARAGPLYPSAVVADAIREHWHGTISQLARDSGVPGATISGILKGTTRRKGGQKVAAPRKHVTLDTADRIFIALGQWLP